MPEEGDIKEGVVFAEACLLLASGVAGNTAGLPFRFEGFEADVEALAAVEEGRASRFCEEEEALVMGEAGEVRTGGGEGRRVQVQTVWRWSRESYATSREASGNTATTSCQIFGVWFLQIGGGGCCCPTSLIEEGAFLDGDMKT